MENKQLKIGGYITLCIVFLLFLLQVNVLYEIHSHEKDIFKEVIHTSIITYIDKLNSHKDTNIPTSRATLNSNKRYVRIIRNDIDTTIHLKYTINSTFTLCKLMYDVRDTIKWNLDSLHKILNPYLQEHGFLVPYQLTLLDSNHKILDQYFYQAFEYENKGIKLSIPLGFLEKHTLKAEFSFPFFLFFQQAWDRLLTTLALILILLLCATTLFLQLKQEKKIGDNRNKFTHALVHNLRSPILTLKRQLEVLQIQLSEQLDPVQAASIEHSEKNTKHLLEDIDHLLFLSVNSCNLVIHPEFCSMEEILNQLVADNQYGHNYKEISITIQNLLPSDYVYADPLHLYGVLNNLIGNSIQYSGDKVAILLLCRKEQQKVFISVKDNGFGIPPEEQKHIFEEHRRGKRYEGDRERQGYGLGLSYVRAVITAHRGHIRIVSDGRHGTEFILEIPQHKKR